MKPRLLDLFCGAGGAAMGYARAGFEVVGVDVKPQSRYPFRFVQADALDVLRCLVGDSLLFDEDDDWTFGDLSVVHASPPCQFYATLGRGRRWRSIPPTRELLARTGLPYVIENINDARWDMHFPVRLCGSMAGLGVRRHRLFETNWPLMVPPCAHGAQREIRAYYGNRGGIAWQPTVAQLNRGSSPTKRGSVSEAPEDMGIDWMTWDELREAIPPAYTELIGYQLLAHLKAQAAA